MCLPSGETVKPDMTGKGDRSSMLGTLGLADTAVHTRARAAANSAAMGDFFTTLSFLERQAGAAFRSVRPVDARVPD
jgi:hypothetical protein